MVWPPQDTGLFAYKIPCCVCCDGPECEITDCLSHEADLTLIGSNTFTAFTGAPAGYAGSTMTIGFTGSVITWSGTLNTSGLNPVNTYGLHLSEAPFASVDGVVYTNLAPSPAAGWNAPISTSVSLVGNGSASGSGSVGVHWRGDTILNMLADAIDGGVISVRMRCVIEERSPSGTLLAQYDTDFVFVGLPTTITEGTDCTGFCVATPNGSFINSWTGSSTFGTTADDVSLKVDQARARLTCLLIDSSYLLTIQCQRRATGSGDPWDNFITATLTFTATAASDESPYLSNLPPGRGGNLFQYAGYDFQISGCTIVKL